jgi:hypothetical protein
MHPCTHDLSEPTRRDFLKLAGTAAAVAVLPRSLRAAEPRRPFEVSASLYAWELHDEGVEQVLDNVQQMSAVNSVYLIGVMHPERRPFREGTFPHNPVRQTWMAEDARCYWHPDPKKYGRVKPRLSSNDWLNRTDWAQVLRDAARKCGLRFGIEQSHTLVDKERAEGEFADLAQRNIHGEITHVRDWLRPLCPNNPATLEYVRAMSAELIANYGMDYFQLCMILFDESVGGRPDRGGGCFCDACKRTAKEAGLDLGKIQATLLADPVAQPALGEWQEFRFQSAARFYQALHTSIHALKPDIDLRYNLHMTNPLDWGVKLTAMQPYLDSLRVMDYSEQEGDPSLMEKKRARLAGLRGELRRDLPIIACLGCRLKATPELLIEGVQISVQTGMNGVALGHYDGATFPMLRGIRAGLVAAKVPV